MFPFSSLIGLECTDHVMRAAIARRSLFGKGGNKGIPASLAQAEVKIPEAAVKGGRVADREKCAGAMDELLKHLHCPQRCRRAVLCLPPNTIYTALLRLPPLPRSRERQEEALRAAIASVFPADAGNVAMTWDVLKKEQDAFLVGVAAMEEEFLRGYLDLCHDAGLTVIGVTSVSAVVASGIGGGSAAFLLVQGGGKAGGALSVTLMDALWPIDEEVLQAEASPERVVEAVRDMLAEARGRNTSIERLLVHGGSAMMNALRAANFPDLLVEEAFPTLKLSEKKWGGVLAASASGGGALNLLSHPRDSARWIYGLLAALGVSSMAALAIALFL